MIVLNCVDNLSVLYKGSGSIKFISIMRDVGIISWSHTFPNITHLPVFFWKAGEVI